MPTPDRIKTPDTFRDALVSLSINRAAFLQAAKLPPSMFSSEARMSTKHFFAMWDALQTLGGDDIGLDLTQTMHGPMLPPSFLVAFHAKTVGEAMHRVARFKALCAPEEFRVATFTFLVNMVRTGTGYMIKPELVELRRSPSERLETWFSCPITWNAPHARLIFEKAENTTSLTDQVRWHLRRALTAGRPEPRGIARDMAVNERSLQRHLKGQGHSFKSHLSDTRHQLAREYLAEPDFDISEIAYLLGYEDQGSLYRAFQKWEHLTPAK